MFQKLLLKPNSLYPVETILEVIDDGKSIGEIKIHVDISYNKKIAEKIKQFVHIYKDRQGCERNLYLFYNYMKQKNPGTEKYLIVYLRNAYPHLSEKVEAYIAIQ